MRKPLACLLFILTLWWLPWDVSSIQDGLSRHWQLALGVSLKLLMHILAIVGLWKDKTYGYAFLLGATVQGSLPATSSFLAIPSQEWWLYKEQLLRPAFDLLVRLLSIGFLATRPGRIVGKGGPK